MKKSNLLILLVAVAVLLAGGIFAAFYFGGKDANRGEKCVPLTDDVAFYVNLDQLITKSAVREVFTSANMSILANVLAAETDDEVSADYVVSLFDNLDNIGMNSKKPIYGYVNMDCNNGEAAPMWTIVAEVSDATKVDKFMSFVAAATGDDFEVIHNKDTRFVPWYEYTIGYNDKRLVVVANSEDEAFALVDEALSRPKADLSMFAKYDIACSVMLDPMVEIMRKVMQAQLAEENAYLQESTDIWEVEWIEEQMASTQKTINTLNDVKSHISDDANIIMGLAFENGRATAEMTINGYDAEYKLDTKIANNHMEYVDDDALAVLNMGVNGEVVSTTLAKAIAPEYADILGISRNEFNLYISIACDAIESINGDVTLALNDVYGGYYGVSGVDAFAAIDVTDNYIISNVATYGQGILTRESKNNYSLNFGGYDFAIGQQDDTLYATVNMDYKKSSTPATESKWYKDVVDSYAYMLINVDSIFENSLVATMWRQAIDNMDKTEAKYIDNLIKACSYIYLTANTPNSAQFVIVFDDCQSNSLEQIFKPLASIAMREVMRSVF